MGKVILFRSKQQGSYERAFLLQNLQRLGKMLAIHAVALQKYQAELLATVEKEKE